jgi:hypothetical protein
MWQINEVVKFDESHYQDFILPIWRNHMDSFGRGQRRSSFSS